MDKRIYKGSSAGQLFPLVDSETSTKDCYFVSGHVIENETKGTNFVRQLLSLPLDQNTERRETTVTSMVFRVFQNRTNYSQIGRQAQ